MQIILELQSSVEIPFHIHFPPEVGFSQTQRMAGQDQFTHGAGFLKNEGEFGRVATEGKRLTVPQTYRHVAGVIPEHAPHDARRAFCVGIGRQRQDDTIALSHTPPHFAPRLNSRFMK